MKQKWHIIWSATPAFEKLQRSDEALLVLVGGLIFTGFFALVLIVASIRRTENARSDDGRPAPDISRRGFHGSRPLLAAAFFHPAEKGGNTNALTYAQERNTRVKTIITTRLNDTLLAFKRMGMRWNEAGGTQENLWRKDALNYTRNLAGLRAIEWIDPGNAIRWIEPFDGNKKAASLNIVTSEEKLRLLQKAIRQQDVVLSPAEELVQGYTAFIAYFPLRVAGRADGFLAGILDIDTLFEASIPDEIKQNFEVSLSQNGHALFAHKIPGEILVRSNAVSSPVEIYDQKLLLTITPTQSFVDSQVTYLHIFTLAEGLLVSLLLAYTLHLILALRVRSAHLARSSELNNAILSASALMIIATDTTGTVKVFNPAAERHLGYKANDIIGKKTPALWHLPEEAIKRAEQISEERGEKVKAGFETFTLRARSHGIDSNEWTFVRADGSHMPVNLTVSPLRDLAGEITGYVGVIEDISQRRANEIERQKLMQRLTESNTNLERFAYVASHDMQEPMRMIANFSGLIQSEYSAKLDEEGLLYLEQVKNSATRIQAMIADLLDFARLKNDMRHFMEVDAEKEMNHVLLNLSSAIKESNAQVTHDPLPRFMGNSVQIMRLLQNLINNGIKYQVPRQPAAHSRFGEG